MSNQQGHSGPNQDGGREQKRKVSGELHVRGEVIVNSPPEVKNANAAEKKKSSRRENLKMWIEGFTLVILFIYAGLTAWQGYSTQKIVNLTRRQLMFSQRPWVGTDLRESPISEIVDGKPIEWHVDFKNYGNSPALQVKWHTRIYVNRVTRIDWPKVQSDIEHLDLSQQMEFTLFTGQKAPNPGVGQIAFPGLSAELLSGVSQVILGGIVQYRDEFGTLHTTTFCVGYNPPKNGIPPGWIACPIKPIAN